MLCILSFLKDLGRIKAIVEANLVECFINLRAREHCCPNGGLPITKTELRSICFGSHSKKLVLVIELFSGAISRAKQLGI